MNNNVRVLLVGGAGYVGAELQKILAESNYYVRVLDTFWYPNGIWDKEDGKFTNRIEYVRGDIRNREIVRESLKDIDVCIHLACISNDPSYELNPDLAKQINFDSFRLFVEEINRSEVHKFIYASSSSVYGVKEEPNVTEDLECEPLTDYSKYKVLCEEMALNEILDDISVTIIRPSTVCGYSRRQRFDLVVNILTLNALRHSVIKVDGGEQFRPNLHIADMISVYKLLIKTDSGVINRKIYNVAGENLTVLDIARKVQTKMQNSCDIQIAPVVDRRSYRVSGAKIAAELGFKPKFSVEDAIIQIQNSYHSNKFMDLDSEIYFNIKRMKLLMNQGSIK